MKSKNGAKSHLWASFEIVIDWRRDVKVTLFDFVHPHKKITITWDAKSLCCKAMAPWRSFGGIINSLWWSKKKSELKTAPLKFPKEIRLEALLEWLGVSFFKEWRISEFPAMKSDWQARECSNYYEWKALIIYNP